MWTVVWANNIKPKELERQRRGEERRGEEPDRQQRGGKVEEEMHNSFMRWPKGICIFHGTLSLARPLSCYVVDRRAVEPGQRDTDGDTQRHFWQMIHAQSDRKMGMRLSFGVLKAAPFAILKSSVTHRHRMVLLLEWHFS